jgi:tryptophan-rich sensory protein
MQNLKMPPYSPPLWAWYVIAVSYYAIVFICVYRVLLHPSTTPFRNAALALLLSTVVLNAIGNLLFFRAKNLTATFALSLGYSLIVMTCWYFLSRFDRVAAAAIGLYGAYLAYANVWGYRIWRLNVAHHKGIVSALRFRTLFLQQIEDH